MNTPVFQTLLGDDWHKLGDVVRRHYTLPTCSDAHVQVRGVMDEVWHAPWVRWLMPFGRLFGALVPFAGRDVPITVDYRCRPDNAHLYWDRTFHFAGRAPFHFRSHMEAQAGNEVIEFVRFGIGMRLAVTAENGALVFRDCGAVWRVGRLRVPVPFGLLLGTAHVEERPVDATHFAMRLVLRHRWFGDAFRYSGRFELPAG